MSLIATHACSHQNRLRQDFSRELARACETELKIDPADGPTTENPFWVDVSILYKSYIIILLIQLAVAIILCVIVCKI